MRILIVTAVEAEAEACRAVAGAHIVVSGIGRTNAAAATTQAIIEHGPFDAVISAGIGGALPGSGLELADIVAADVCIYIEEGVELPEGFRDMEALGFRLGDFAGNRVPVDQTLLRGFSTHFRTGAIATVATCSGTDEAARHVRERSGALVEAMEGAAVVHAARRLGIAGIEVRAVSNTTGNRATQRWDVHQALASLQRDLPHAIAQLTQH